MRHTLTSSTVRRRRLPPDSITRGMPEHALAFDDRNQVGWLPLAPSHSTELWLTISAPTRSREVGRELGRDAGH
jgi:hypothetical protein